ncbi:hypothetical protein BV898_02592 [Hypsibius exemplaris]|uniref:Uncharacterized protein n=1 Tax=Hypsibius exemplaris TaxID=2072580 RepID=A0A1W0X7J9_HYPEX|nr:hypothetical protein BV898_02592 [Hypsibius exemplaris]
MEVHLSSSKISATLGLFWSLVVFLQVVVNDAASIRSSANREESSLLQALRTKRQLGYSSYQNAQGAYGQGMQGAPGSMGQGGNMGAIGGGGMYGSGMSGSGMGPGGMPPMGGMTGMQMGGAGSSTYYHGGLGGQQQPALSGGGLGGGGMGGMSGGMGGVGGGYPQGMQGPSAIGSTYGGARGGFSYNPEVGVVGPQGYGGGYEQLGIGQYPFLDPKTYWAVAGVSTGTPSKSASSALPAVLLGLLSTITLTLLCRS